MAACRDLYAAIDALDQEAADAAGITRNDLRALNLLEGGAIRAGEIADALSLTSGAVSTLIDRLEQRGLARRTPDPTDRRAVLVEPTPRLFEDVGTVYVRVAKRVALLATEYSDRKLDQAIKILNEVSSAYRPND
ncbi:MAG: MarR family transcriptional regulator [Myxococcota bacterium]